MRIQEDAFYHSQFLSRDTARDDTLRFKFTSSKICLFISSAPCGDACLDILGETPAKAEPWIRPKENDIPKHLHGHEYIWERGRVRFKPGNSEYRKLLTIFSGRRDSPPTFSKSCSDKLALKSATSLLNSLLANIIDPATCYLDCLILPKPAFHGAGLRRAFQQRLQTIHDCIWPGGFHVKMFQTLTTNLPMSPTLTLPTTLDNKNLATASTSIIFVDRRPLEVILGGIKMGSPFPPSVRGASYLCRATMGQDFLNLIAREAAIRPPLKELFPKCTYGALKEKMAVRAQPVKCAAREALGHWERNEGDDDIILVAQ